MKKKYGILGALLIILAGCAAETITDVELSSDGSIFAASDQIATDFVNAGDSFVKISHGQPTGGYTITRDSNSQNWIFQTTSDYSGSDGPLLFFYISKETYNASVSANDQRYVDSNTSAVLHTSPISSNSGQLTYEVQNSASQSILDFQTIVLWCESAKTIFYIAKVTPL